MKVYDRLDRQYEKFADEYKQAAIRVLDSGWYVLGREVEDFEKEFADYTGSPYCVGLNSGLDALILAVKSLNIGAGDEVIVPANTYIATVLGITANGAVPVFCEPDEFYNLDASRIESLITDKTRAIMVVHLYGQAANMTAIKSITRFCSPLYIFPKILDILILYLFSHEYLSNHEYLSKNPPKRSP